MLSFDGSDDFEKCVNDEVPFLTRFQLKSELQTHLKQVKLFTSKAFSTTLKKDHILGRFDVLVVPALMDYDHEWKFRKQSQNQFLIHHAAAINIGESANADDFEDYSKNGHLDEDKYIRDMGQVFHNILSAQEKSGVKHAVWFPFGMGAFLEILKRMTAFIVIRIMRDGKKWPN